MVITTRTLIWLGLIVALFSGAALAIVVWNVPPSTGPLILFFALAFLTVTGLAQVVIGIFQHVRGQDRPARALRWSVQVGLAATALLVLQYFDMLTFITGGAVILLSAILEILFYLARPSPPPRASGPSRKSTHTLASQRPRGPARKRKK